MSFALARGLRRVTIGLAVALGFAIMWATPALADQPFGYPQVNGAAVDNCAVWGTDCGWGGAHQFCRTQGYAGARSFQLYNPGRTFVIGSQRFCEGGNCVGFSQVICIAGNTAGGGDMPFNAPQVNGAAVDNCAVWATDCGWGGAHQFCRTQGYAAAKSWTLYNPGRTWVIGSQRFCDGGGCVGFSQVICTSGGGQPPQPPQPPTTTGGPLAGKWAWAGTNNNFIYFQQNGGTFTWSQPESNETAQGTINGDALTVTWTNPGGTQSATGTITARDGAGRAARIQWSNGVIFERKD